MWIIDPFLEKWPGQAHRAAVLFAAQEKWGEAFGSKSTDQGASVRGTERFSLAKYRESLAGRPLQRGYLIAWEEGRESCVLRGG